MRTLVFGASIFLCGVLATSAPAHAASKKPKQTKATRSHVPLEERDLEVLKRQQAIGTFRGKRLAATAASLQNDVHQLTGAKNGLHWGTTYGKVDLGLDKAIEKTSREHAAAKKATDDFQRGDMQVYREIQRRIDAKTAPFEKKLVAANREYETAYRKQQELGYAVDDFKSSSNATSVAFLAKEGERLGVASVVKTIAKLEKDHAAAVKEKDALAEKVAGLEDKIAEIRATGEVVVKTQEMADAENAARRPGRSKKVATKK